VVLSSNALLLQSSLDVHILTLTRQLLLTLEDVVDRAYMPMPMKLDLGDSTKHRIKSGSKVGAMEALPATPCGNMLTSSCVMEVVVVRLRPSGELTLSLAILEYHVTMTLFIIVHHHGKVSVTIFSTLVLTLQY
jgi:hypothetical protein